MKMYKIRPNYEFLNTKNLILHSKSIKILMDFGVYGTKFRNRENWKFSHAPNTKCLRAIN